MADRWQHADYAEQSTDAERLSKARRHQTEIRQAIGADTSSQAGSRSSGSLLQLLDAVARDIMEYEDRVPGGPRAPRATRYRRPVGRRGA